MSINSFQPPSHTASRTGDEESARAKSVKNKGHNKYSQRPYNDFPLTRAANVSYAGHFFASLNPIGLHPRSSEDFWESPFPSARSSRSRVSVDVITKLPLSVMKYTGGDHGANYAIENMLHPDNSVYCAAYNHCSAILQVGGSENYASLPLISEINIVAPPPAAYTSPVQNVAIFMAMDYSPDLVERSDQYLRDSEVGHLFQPAQKSSLSTARNSMLQSAFTSYANSVAQTAVNSSSGSIYATPTSQRRTGVNTNELNISLQRILGERQALSSTESSSEASSTVGDDEILDTPALSRANASISTQHDTTEHPLAVGASSLLQNINRKKCVCEEDLLRNIVLFKEELDPRFGANSLPTTLLGDDSGSLDNQGLSDTFTEKEEVVTVKYTLGAPKYRCDPFTSALELDHVERQLRLRNHEPAVSHRENFQRARGRQTPDDDIEMADVHSSIHSRQGDSGEIEVTTTAGLHDAEYLFGDDLDDFVTSDSDRFGIPSSAQPQRFAGPSYDIETYNIKTTLSNSKWATSGPLHPVALASIPSNNIGNKRHLNIKFSEGIMARYLVLKFSNIATKGTANVDIESVSVYGIESDGPCIESI